MAKRKQTTKTKTNESLQPKFTNHELKYENIVGILSDFVKNHKFYYNVECTEQKKTKRTNTLLGTVTYYTELSEWHLHPRIHHSFEEVGHDKETKREVKTTIDIFSPKKNSEEYKLVYRCFYKDMLSSSYTRFEKDTMQGVANACVGVLAFPFIDDDEKLIKDTTQITFYVDENSKITYQSAKKKLKKLGLNFVPYSLGHSYWRDTDRLYEIKFHIFNDKKTWKSDIEKLRALNKKEISLRYRSHFEEHYHCTWKDFDQFAIEYPLDCYIIHSNDTF